jgi:hypothetical protein
VVRPQEIIAGLAGRGGRQEEPTERKPAARYRLITERRRCPLSRKGGTSLRLDIQFRGSGLAVINSRRATPMCSPSNAGYAPGRARPANDGLRR